MQIALRSERPTAADVSIDDFIGEVLCFLSFKGLGDTFILFRVCLIGSSRSVFLVLVHCGGVKEETVHHRLFLSPSFLFGRFYRVA